MCTDVCPVEVCWGTQCSDGWCTARCESASLLTLPSSGGPPACTARIAPTPSPVQVALTLSGPRSEDLLAAAELFLLAAAEATAASLAGDGEAPDLRSHFGLVEITERPFHDNEQLSNQAGSAQDASSPSGDRRLAKASQPDAASQPATLDESLLLAGASVFGGVAGIVFFSMSMAKTSSSGLESLPRCCAS